MSNKTPIDGRSYLYTQKGSSKWYAHLFVDKERITFSTKESDIEKARAKALKQLGALESDINNRHSGKKSAFGVVAQEYIKSIEESSSATKNDKTYCSALRKYHIPFFGKIKINKITEENIEDFNVFREKIFGKPFSKSTILNHNAAMNKVFRLAVRKGLMKKSDIPSLESFGERTKSRDQFQVEDIIKIQDYLLNTKSKNKVRNETFQLLYDYIDFVLNTGVRPGTEVNHIQWKDLVLYVKDNIVRLGVNVRKGKNSSRKGARKVVPKYAFMYNYLDLIRNNPDRDPEDYVFRTKSGKSLDQVGKVFSDILLKLDIKEGVNGPRTLYSLRQTFVTSMLKDGWNHHVIAKALGTSVQMIEAHYDKSTIDDFEDQILKIKIEEDEDLDYKSVQSYILENYGTYKGLVREFIRQKKSELGEHYRVDDYIGVLQELRKAKTILDNEKQAYIVKKEVEKRRRAEIKAMAKKAKIKRPLLTKAKSNSEAS